jgi:hypothetical protein
LRRKKSNPGSLIGTSNALRRFIRTGTHVSVSRIWITFNRKSENEEVRHRTRADERSRHRLPETVNFAAQQQGGNKENNNGSQGS